MKSGTSSNPLQNEDFMNQSELKSKFI